MHSLPSALEVPHVRHAKSLAVVDAVSTRYKWRTLGLSMAVPRTYLLGRATRTFHDCNTDATTATPMQDSRHLVGLVPAEDFGHLPAALRQRLEAIVGAVDEDDVLEVAQLVALVHRQHHQVLLAVGRELGRRV